MKNNRWLQAILGLAAFVLLGLLYAWSVFVGPLEGEFGWLRSETSLTFSISMASLCIGCLLAGFISKRLKPQLMMALSAVFVMAGFLLSSTISSLIGLYVCYGVICGLGVGIGYNTILSSVLKWFPDKQGIISGILLMGFGFGGSSLGSFAVYLMELLGWRSTFQILGIGLGVLILVCAILLRVPSAEQIKTYTPPAKTAVLVTEYTTKEMVKTSTFRNYFLWAAIASAAGLVLFGCSAPMAMTMTSDIATAAFVAGLVSIFNGIGRFTFGFWLDSIGSKKCFTIITFGYIVAMIVLLAAVTTQTFALLAVGFCFAGFFYGGITPSNSAFTGKIFGQKHYSRNFSIVNMVLLVAAFLGPYVSGILQSNSEGYLSTIWFMLILMVVSLVFMLMISMHTVGSSNKKRDKKS